MTQYERAMLKLKVLEVTQRQALIAIQTSALNTPVAITIAQESKTATDRATTWVAKLLENDV